MDSIEVGQARNKRTEARVCNGVRGDAPGSWKTSHAKVDAAGWGEREGTQLSGQRMNGTWNQVVQKYGIQKCRLGLVAVSGHRGGRFEGYYAVCLPGLRNSEAEVWKVRQA